MSRDVDQPSPGASSLLVAGLCVLLCGITWLVFAQTLSHDFVNYDDRTYVYGNPVVTSGVTWRGIAWAFTHAHARNWHPLTTLSHMLDCQLFGLNAGGPHFTNVLLHTVSVLLLFFLLRRMTGALWRSLFVAAVFAIHPLRVESVVWIAERKDVLSAVFFMLTLGAYVRYARKPTLGRYVTMSILFALGLMSKPMLVTTPFVLLLLDYWPLNRFSVEAGVSPATRGNAADTAATTVSIVDRRSARRLLIEKIPLFILSLASCVATVIAQSGSIGSIEPLPLASRINNALISYVTYIWQMLWPVDLAVFYPHPENLPRWQIILSALLLIAISALAIALRKKRPYILTGWFWYLGMLVPVIGVFQIGLQGHADRYTYLPHIGLYLVITWIFSEMSILRGRREILFGLSAVVLFALAWCAWNQTAYWKTSETLWKHTLAVTSDNDVAHNNLGLFYEQRGLLDDAVSQYEAALNIQSVKTEVRYDLSTALTHNNLGNALSGKGQLSEALLHYEKAVELRPDYADGHYNLGNLLLRQGELDKAITEWEKTVSIQPDDAEAHTALGNALLRKGSLREAIDHYEKAITADVPSVFALNNLAWVLSTSPDASFRNGPRAIDLAHRAVNISQEKIPTFIRTSAAALAEAGHFNDAIEIGQRAAALARAQHDVDLAREIEEDLNLYRRNSPLRDSSLTNAR